MSLYMIPALLALLIKVAVLGASWQSSRNTVMPKQDSRVKHTLGVFTTMVLIMAGHNLAEVLGFLEFSKDATAESLLRWYYVMSVFTLSVITYYAATVSRQGAELSSGRDKAIIVGLLISAVLLSGAFLLSDFIVAGSTSLGFVMTAIKGPGYVLFEAFSLLCFIVIVAFLLHGYKKAQNQTAEIKCLYTLLALTPILIAGVVLVALIGFGYDVSAAMVMPLASALFLVILLVGEQTHRLVDIRRHIPFSLERRTTAKINDIFSAYSRDELNYRDALNEIERMLVVHKHQKHNGNVSSTAASMELPRSSLYSIFRRLEIDIKE